jgi:sugar lactone lactonase YvrE
LGSLLVECVVPGPARLGECPLWSDAEQTLYWVDIEGRAIHRFDPATGIDESRSVPGRPGSIALTADRGRLLVALENGLAFVDWDSGSCDRWLDLEPAGTGNRLNDGRCDPAGRFWVGSMFDPTSAGRSTGLLHRVGPQGEVVVVRSGIGVANGLAFSPDDATMYFADTRRETVWAYDFDPASGEPANERVFLDFSRPDLPGRPDGACVDQDGCYWIACVYGWSVLRVTPDGVVDRRIDMPVEKPTMPAFGGPSMTTLFVTSIGEGGSRPLAPGQPNAGGVFAVETSTRGVAEPRFAGQPIGLGPR